MADPGREALRELDGVLAKRPERDMHALSELTRSLAAFRSQLAREGSGKLGHVNAVISIVLAVHYPLTHVPWDDLQTARGWLKDAVA